MHLKKCNVSLFDIYIYEYISFSGLKLKQVTFYICRFRLKSKPLFKEVSE